MITLRPNQRRTIDTLYDWFRANPHGHPIVDACVGAGKSIMLAQLCREAAVGFDRPSRVLMIVPSKELCEQNLHKLETLAPDLRIGVCSASLGRKEVFRDTDLIIGTIGTLYRQGTRLGFFDLLMVDECHLVNRADTGMFRDLINILSAINPDIRVIGWTGTPFRGNGVWLHDGEERIFTDIAARLSMRELLDDGYLSPLVNAPTETQISGDGLRISGGDYVIHDLAQRIDQPGITERIAAEIVKLGQDRDRWLVYGVTVAHAQHLQTALQSHGIMTGFVCGATPKVEREKVIAAFRSGRLRAVVNVAVLTTGFDLPEVDLLALVRNTRSPVLAVQIAGRGMRIAEGKRDCLWCDFTDTTARLGPIDQIKGRAAPTSKRQAAPKPYKLCQQCGKVNPIGSAVCMECGAEFEKPASVVNLQVSDAPILSDGSAPKPRLETFEVDRILAFPKKSKAGRDYLQIVYHCGLDRFTDALMIGGEGRAGAMAAMKWRHAVETDDGSVIQVPRNPGEAYRLLEESRVRFRSVGQITVDMNSKYRDIVKVG